MNYRASHYYARYANPLIAADERGSVVAESDASGQVVTTYSYGPYGEPDSTAGGRLRYTGQMLIPELGLYHYR